MANQLLVRAYDVEVGDCIYVRIPEGKVLPDGKDDFHILVDCGTRGKADLIDNAIAHLKAELPASSEEGKNRLDLLVVTHEHSDHIKGFDPTLFKEIKIENIWLSAAMNPQHEGAEDTHELHRFATQAMRSIAAEGVSLNPELEDLVSLFGINNDDAMEALTTGLPEASGIETTYVQAGMSSQSLGVDINDAMIHVLGPEKEIDFFYLGEDSSTGLRGFRAAGEEIVAVGCVETGAAPVNISPADFRVLKSRLLSNAFAFAELSNKVKNNTSTVLLIEWQDHRLLFVGDLEWEGSFKEGKHNGGWNVLWKQRIDELEPPVGFLKIGHHGSTNATPWNDKQDGAVTEPSQILDGILPLPADGEEPTAAAIVSTKRKGYKTIPSSALLVELGKRVRTARRYETVLKNKNLDPTSLPKYENYEKAFLDSPQPLRTDLEQMLEKTGYVEVEIPEGN